MIDARARLIEDLSLDQEVYAKLKSAGINSVADLFEHLDAVEPFVQKIINQIEQAARNERRVARRSR